MTSSAINWTEEPLSPQMARVDEDGIFHTSFGVYIETPIHKIPCGKPDLLKS
jgi:hypothetical protein